MNENGVQKKVKGSSQKEEGKKWQRQQCIQCGTFIFTRKARTKGNGEKTNKFLLHTHTYTHTHKY